MARLFAADVLTLSTHCDERLQRIAFIKTTPAIRAILTSARLSSAVELGLSGDLGVLRSTAREELGLRNEVLA